VFYMQPTSKIYVAITGVQALISIEEGP